MIMFKDRRVPPDHHSQWTTDTLREYILALLAGADGRYAARFDAMEKATAAALSSAQTAVLKAEDAAEKRFASVNEFRSTLADQQRNLMPRAEVDVVVRALQDKIAALEKQQDNILAERAGVKGGYGFAVGAAGLLLTLVSLGVLIVQAIKP